MAAYEIGLLIIGFAISWGSHSATVARTPPAVVSDYIRHIRAPPVHGYSWHSISEPGREPSYDRAAHRTRRDHLTYGSRVKKIDRPFSLKTWSAAWRLILIALPDHCWGNGSPRVGIIGLLPSHAHLTRGRDRADRSGARIRRRVGAPPPTELEEEQDPRQRWGGRFDFHSLRRPASTTG